MIQEQTSIENNELNCTTVRLSHRLMEVQELFPLLGYDDKRSVKAWCESNKVPLITIGKRTYTVRNFVEMLIEKQLNEFVTANYSNPAEVMRAVINDEELKPVMNKPVIKSKVAKPDKKKMSAAAQRFLNDE